MRETFLLILFLFILSCKSDNKEFSSTEFTERIGIKKFKVADENIKDSIVEYIKINGKEYANQIWIVDKKNDTIGGNYFTSYIKEDTIKFNEVAKLRFILTKPTINWESDMFVVLPFDDNDLKDDFSNMMEIKLDTFHSLKNDGIPHPEISNLDLPLNHITEFGLKSLTPGKKRVRGIIVERGKLDSKGYERRLFFDESYYVKE